MLVMFAQFEKVRLLIVVNFVPLKSTAPDKPEPWNALFPIEVSPLNELKSKSVKLVQFWKALFGIDVNLLVPITVFKLVAPCKLKLLMLPMLAVIVSSLVWFNALKSIFVKLAMFANTWLLTSEIVVFWMFGKSKVPCLSFAPWPFTGAIAISVNPVFLNAE